MERIRLSFRLVCLFSGITLCTFLLVLPVPGYAGRPTVIDSRHNLGAAGRTDGVINENYLDSTASNTRSVCVFCHTPHGSNLKNGGGDSVGPIAPLWNKSAGTQANYSMYSSPTLDSPPSSSPLGVSLACLTCHDGTQAMDVMVNIPGSEGWKPGMNMSKGGVDVPYVWGGMAKMSGGKIGKMVSNLGLGSGMTILGNNTADLRNDHPISMPYAGLVSTSAVDNAVSTGANDGYVGPINDVDPNYFQARKIIKGKNSIALVAQSKPAGGLYRDVSLSNRARDGDIRLWPSNKNASNVYYVECASCHNPHGTDNGGMTGLAFQDADAKLTGIGVGNKAQQGAYPTFLQRPNFRSQLCLTCHVK